MVIVAVMAVRRTHLPQFREFETAAAKLMLRYSGLLERSVVVDDGESPELQEIHVVSFPQLADFEAYQRDPELLPLRPLRDAAVVSSKLYVGEDGPNYLSVDSR